MTIIRKKFGKIRKISIKFGGFYLIKMNCAVDKHAKISIKILVEICISTNIQKIKYRPVTPLDWYISQSLVCICIFILARKACLRNLSWGNQILLTWPNHLLSQDLLIRRSSGSINIQRFLNLFKSYVCNLSNNAW